jgi:hypothetical protein
MTARKCSRCKLLETRLILKSNELSEANSRIAIIEEELAEKEDQIRRFVEGMPDEWG